MKSNHLLFDSKIKEVAKSNLQAQQHRFLASSTNNLSIQPQKPSYIWLQVLSGNLDSLLNLLDLNRINHIGLGISHCPLRIFSRPRWLSWMRRPTGDQEVAGSTPAEVGNILSWRLIMKYFLRSFSPFRWFKKGSCQFLAKECAQYWLTA